MLGDIRRIDFDAHAGTGGNMQDPIAAAAQGGCGAGIGKVVVELLELVIGAGVGITETKCILYR